MSDQTPPASGPNPERDSEPTPEPGVEPTPADGGAPQDPDATSVDRTVIYQPAVDPTGPAGPTDPTAAPPKKKFGTGKILALIAGVVVLVLIAGGLVGYLVLKNDAHKITTPSTAGSMKRDTAKEKDLSTQLDQAEEQFKSQGESKGKSASVSYVKSAVYDQDDTGRGPKGSLVFLGAKLDKVQSPTKWVNAQFSKQAKANVLTVTDVDPGEGGGKAACASVTSPQKIAVCAWATTDTIGELVPTVVGYDTKTLAKIMRDVRSDVEQDE
jgi:hypothetical protein